MMTIKPYLHNVYRRRGQLDIQEVDNGLMLKATEKTNFPNKWKDLAAVGSPINEELFDRDAMFSVAVQRWVHLRLARKFGLWKGYSNLCGTKVEISWTLVQKQFDHFTFWIYFFNKILRMLNDFGDKNHPDKLVETRRHV